MLRTVLESLGDLPSRPAPPRARIISREIRPGYALEKVSISNGVDGEVTALLLVPAGRKGPVPAILWLHSLTPDKTQVIIPGTNGGAEPLGEAFVRAGYAVLSPDSYWHGDRVGTGPSGRRSGAGPRRMTCSNSTSGSVVPSGACSFETTRSRSTTSAAARK